jgi:hypothetical protein
MPRNDEEGLLPELLKASSCKKFNTMKAMATIFQGKFLS